MKANNIQKGKFSEFVKIAIQSSNKVEVNKRDLDRYCSLLML